MSDAVGDFMEALDAHCEAFKPPFQVVTKVVEYTWTFADNHFPDEVASDDEPPIKLGKRLDAIPICGFLGLYNPQEQLVTVFNTGVKRAAEAIGCKPHDLRLVVRLHEWSHALLHIGLEKDKRQAVTSDDAMWPSRLTEANDWFKTLDTELHERLAQLLTHHALQSLQAEARLQQAQAGAGRLISAFEQLARRQPPEYQIEKYASVPKQRLLGSIRLLKQHTLIGSAAWDTVITW